MAWHAGNAGQKTQTVGQKLANAWGLFDMLGNVYEWTNDWLADYAAGATDPVGPPGGELWAFRGGSWLFVERPIRLARRQGDTPSHRAAYLGFRPVRTAN